MKGRNRTITSMISQKHYLSSMMMKGRNRAMTSMISLEQYSCSRMMKRRNKAVLRTTIAALRVE